jgi:hypothetical protein
VFEEPIDKILSPNQDLLKTSFLASFLPLVFFHFRQQQLMIFLFVD